MFPDDFVGKGKPITDDGFSAAASDLGVKAAELWAVFHVETRGFGFLTDRRPLILFERHKFHAATAGRFSTPANLDVSNPESGGYGGGGAHQYDRLAKAMTLNLSAALTSTSWGVGQVMGFHAATLGYADVQDMVGKMCESEDAQLAAVVAFLTRNKLEKFLQTHNWASFASRYNGSEYAKNRYDTRLQAAYDRFVTGPLPDLRLRTAQACLSYLDYDPRGIDGVSGKFTRAATADFQRDQSLSVTGDLDADTYDRLLQRAGF